jgi:predicted transcriptional regulator
MSVTTVRLQAEVESGLEAIAGKLSRSKSWVINQALREYLERQEQEQTRWQETLKAMESVAQGRVVSGEAVHAWLHSWGADDELAPPKAGQ